MSAGSTTDTDGGVSPMWECEEKENMQQNDQNRKLSDPKAQTDTDTVTDNQSKKSITETEDNEDISPEREIQPAAVPASVKRTFSDLEKSPEQFEIQAKKSTADYKRCFEIPNENAKFHTGLTGTFSTINLGDFMAFSEDQIPNRSSPITVAKSLFSELEEPAEDVFEEGAKDSSFTSPLAQTSDICRSLSLDSDGSMHETSLTIDSHKPSHNTTNRNSTSSDEKDDNKDSPPAKKPT